MGLLMVSFGNFRFDARQQVLYRLESPVALTQKQTQLLALFLSEPDTVFSKEDILDHVWGGRAVSEQVVFQNISKLRTLIHSDAIKTYPKRGYQWQLPLHSNSNSLRTPSATVTANEGSSNPAATRLFWPAALAATIIVGLITLWFNSRDASTTTSAQQSNVSFLPFGARFGGPQLASLKEINQLLNAEFGTAANRNNTIVSARAFMNSSFMERKKLGLKGQSLLISGMLRQVHGHHFLVYRIQGQYRSWEAYVIAKNGAALAKAAIDQVRLVATSQYFSLQNEALVTAELELLHNQNPTSSAILSHLIDRHLEEANHDVAGAYIDKLVELSRHKEIPAYHATALWLKGKRALALRDLETASRYLGQAATITEQAGLLFIQSEIAKSMADVAFNLGDFEPVRAHLLKAASLARLAAEPVNEIRAYTLLSIMAGKLALHQEKFDYLLQAKSLLADGGLDASHYMLVFYHLALFAKDVAEQERWYQETLSQPVTPENTWVFESAADNLVKLLIREKRWQEALAVAEKAPSDATSHKLKAMAFLSQGDKTRGVAEAQQAFTLARVKGDRWVGMPTALMLLENSEPDSDTNNATDYRQYLRANRKGRWEYWQREKLARLGIE